MLAIIAVSGIMIFYNLDTFYASDNNASKSFHGAYLVSNVEVVQRDEAGNIVAYRQGSNHIVATGMELIARQVFGNGAEIVKFVLLHPAAPHPNTCRAMSSIPVATMWLLPCL